MSSDAAQSGGRRRLELKLGSRVVAIDSETGRLAAVIIEPGTGKLDGLVVIEGLLRRRDVIVPMDAVADADEDRVGLRLLEAQLNELPEYRPESYFDPLAPTALPRLGSKDARPIHQSHKVRCLDAEIGVVDLMLWRPSSDHVSFLVVRRGLLLKSDRLIAPEWIQAITRQVVELSITKSEVDALPEYRSDGDIEAQVLDELWSAPDIDPADLTLVGVRCEDGFVHLSGHSRTEAGKYAIEARVRRIPSVLGVINQIEPIESLARHSRATASDA